MKPYLLLLFSLCCTTVQAQYISCEERIQSQLIDKIKSYESNELVPYFDEEARKWGFIDRKKRKRLTEPIFNDANFFTPSLNLYYELEMNGEDGCDAKILGSNEGYQLASVENSDYQIYMEAGGPEPDEDFSIYIKDEISGFEVGEKGNFTFFNSKFYNPKNKRSTLEGAAIEFNKVYYAINAVITESGVVFEIIDQNGNTMPGFSELKSYPRLKFGYLGEDDLWFLINAGNDEYKFRSLLGQRTLPEVFSYPSNWLNYAQTLGYAIMTADGAKGLLDLTTMTWKIKPAKKNDFSYLHYMSQEQLSKGFIENDYSIDMSLRIPIDVMEANRKLANIYIENSKRKLYDLNLKVYAPKPVKR